VTRWSFLQKILQHNFCLNYITKTKKEVQGGIQGSGLDKSTVLQKSNFLPFLYFSFVYVIRFITNRRSTLSFVFSRSDCHLTIVTVIHWITIDHVLLYMIMIDHWKTENWLCYKEDNIKGLVQNYCNYLILYKKLQ